VRDFVPLWSLPRAKKDWRPTSYPLGHCRTFVRCLAIDRCFLHIANISCQFLSNRSVLPSSICLNTLKPFSYNRHPSPHTPHPTPHTPHPTSYTQHHTLSSNCYSQFHTKKAIRIICPKQNTLPETVTREIKGWRQTRGTIKILVIFRQSVL